MNHAEDGAIYTLYVLRAFQQKGIGKGLFLFACSSCARGDMEMRLSTGCRGTDPAIYLVRGERIVGQRSDWADGAFLTEQIVCLVKRDA